MNLPERSARPWLLAALPLAWASSALFVLGHGCLAFAFIPLAWLAIAWKCHASRRAVFVRRTLALLVAVALPAQGFAATVAEVSGPAHVHAAAKLGAAHWHAGVMHHHHAHGDAVVVDDGKRSQAALASGESKRLAFSAVDALAAPIQTFPLPLPADEPEATQTAEPAPQATRPPERPPRALSAFLPS